MISEYYINSGIGDGDYELTSLDSALINAGFGNYNLVRVSSILPPKANGQDTITVQQGEPLHVAYGVYTSNRYGETIASAVAVAIPQDKTKIGVIMETAGCLCKKEAERVVDIMVRQAMRRRGYRIEQVLISSAEYTVADDMFHTVFSGIAIW